MNALDPSNTRVFLFLQGPHGPFFNQLARQLERTGAQAWRIGFNAGDEAFWGAKSRYIAFRGTRETWKEELQSTVLRLGVTDLVLYGDTRPVHAQAITVARAMGLNIHVFEEGYLRPYWVTYELGGTNGNSRLVELSIDDIRQLCNRQSYERPAPPGHWGDMRQHVFYGAAYHWFVLAMNRSYPDFQPHRDLNVRSEFKLHLKRLMLMPLHAADRYFATRRIRKSAFPYHLALLQLEHDSSFRDHGPFDTQSDFAACVINGFAHGAPRHHHLVFKAHPLEDGRQPIRADIAAYAKALGVADRVHFLRGGKLARLLNDARSATTVNSTAAQQALWRGLPVRAFGQSVYSKPELVSHQPLEEFFAAPDRPDSSAYRHFRDFLLATSQLPGGYYSKKGRLQLLRTLPDLMLLAQDPYALAGSQSAALRQQFRIVQ